MKALVIVVVVVLLWSFQIESADSKETKSPKSPTTPKSTKSPKTPKAPKGTSSPVREPSGEVPPTAPKPTKGTKQPKGKTQAPLAPVVIPSAPVKYPSNPVPTPTAPIPLPSPPPLPSPTPPSIRTNAWINEFHYDNLGRTDSGEFVEVMATSATDLTGWSVVFYDGRDNPNAAVVYDTKTFVSSGTVSGGIRIASLPVTTGILNGPSDGMALVDPMDNVYDFVSYEGTIAAADGPAQGLTSTDVGVLESAFTRPGYSLQRSGTGCSKNSFTQWIGPVPSTRNTINSDQSVVCSK